VSKNTNVDAADLLEPLRRIHQRVRDAVIQACEQQAIEELARVDDDSSEGDTLYAVDRVSERVLIQMVEKEAAPIAPLILVGEGLERGGVVLPEGTPVADALFRIIVDPIDGTRPLMYQKRSAWIMTGVAPNLGEQTTLQDIKLAVQTEIPTLKQNLCDSLWAVRGSGVGAERFDRVTEKVLQLRLKPSTARTIRHGFAGIARFFPGARDELAAIDEEIVKGALGDVQRGKAHCFEDQYLSTGGQLYELMSGHDRFIADLRPLMEPGLNRRGLALGICCHPYDVCTELIAREIGVIVTDHRGEPLRAPLDTESNVAWVGYANKHIQQEVQPLLQQALERRGLAD
jgi:hypothetical protein